MLFTLKEREKFRPDDRVFRLKRKCVFHTHTKRIRVSRTQNIKLKIMSRESKMLKYLLFQLVLP
jgi:hypothetical protein